MKRKTAGRLALLMAAAMTTSTFFGTSIPARAADNWIGDDQLEDNSTEEPEKDEVLPNKNQYNYQKEELAAFCHFGPNTFNEIEWGEHYGDKTPNEIFKLTKDFDAETLVSAIKEAGFHKLIVTAKHHDGFCIWASDYTEYDVDAATNYPGDEKTGERDILAEISAACTEYDIDMGLYLSPWDIHDDSYGYYDENGNSLLNSSGKPLNGMTWEEVEEKDVKDYNEYYNNQLTEILSDDKYGNNGHFVEVWMDGAKGSGASAQNYDFEKWFDTIQKYEGKASGKYDSDCMLFGAQAYTTVRWIGNENGYAHKNTWSKSRVNYENNTIDSRSSGGYTLGWEDGNQWTVPESDARITSGWFWGTTKAAPKSIEALGTMYFNSVGHNSPLLLNIPPNNQGTVDEAILNRVAEFGENIRDTFDDNMAAAKAAEVKASEVRGNDSRFKPGNTVDGDDDTYWTTSDGTSTGSLLIDLGSAKKFDVVSIEEAIQNGQRINHYKVEYRNGSGDWNLLDEGDTIGAKRLVRTSAVTADQVKITVETTDDKVPMISEVGVYKASEGFELAASAPTGMDVIDIEDTDTSDGTGFAFTGSWTKETGTNFVNETNRWANAGSSLTLKFKGTKVYLVGTKDPNHGTASISIDGKAAVTVDTSATERSTGQIWFSSDDLDDGEHTLTLNVTNKAIGIEAAYVINNGGIGMIGLEADEYTMNEDETMNVKITRVGGTKGRIKAYLSPNPGSAIQDDFYTEPTVVTLADGESETTAPVTTRRNTKETGTQNFTIELNSPSSGLILGFIDTAKVNILDAESMDKEQLQELVDLAETYIEQLYAGDWDAFESALAAAKALLAQDSPDALEMGRAYAALENAMNALTERAQFTESDPVVFPTKKDETITVEAELLEMDSSGAASGKEVRISSDASCSNGKYINWFETGNKLYMYYDAPKAGTYEVTLSYASGRKENNPNDITFAEESGNIEQTKRTFVGVDGDTNGSKWGTQTFDLVVNEAGAGKIILSTETGGPKFDKLEITPKEIAFTYDVKAEAAAGGTISPAGTTRVDEGGSQVYTITPDAGYEISKVIAGGEDVTDSVQKDEETGVCTYTAADVNSDLTVNVIFSFANYTESNRFQFPTEAEGSAVTLEAEHFTLHNTGENEKWPLEVAEASWASGGKFVNSLNADDSISVPYYAEKAGTYEVTAVYRSGSAANKLVWSSTPEGHIQNGETAAGATDSSQTKEVKFTITLTKPGAGVWTFTGPSGQSPQLDKFDIVLTEETAVIADKIDLEIAMQNAERELAREDTYTEESRAALAEALAEAEEVFENAYATQAEADAAAAALEEAIENLDDLSYKITTSTEGGGTLTPSADTVDRGGSVDIAITPDYGYTLTSLKVNGAEVSNFHKYNVSYTISNINGDQEVTAAFEKTGYTVEEPFQFPTGTETATLEAEHFTLFNVDGDTEQYKMAITTGSTGDWSKGAVYINAFEPGDSISVPYNAKAGTYEVKVTYSSGSATNKLVWSSDGTIEDGQVSAGNTYASEFVTVTFDVTVTEDGTGVWTFTAPTDGKSPRVDKFEITAKDSEPDEKYTVTARVEGGNGTITPQTTEAQAGGSVTFTITPDKGYEISDVKAGGKSVLDDVNVEEGTYTLSNINADTEVVVSFKAVEGEPDQYTEEHPFYFPTERNGSPVTLEAEKLILHNTGSGEAWPLQISEGDWASGGKFVNAMNTDDSITLYYVAEKAGTYTATIQYRSGDSNNSMTWKEADGKIADGSLDSVTADNASSLQVRTVEIELEVVEPGAGVLTFTAGSKNAPQLDKFDIVLTSEPEEDKPDKTALEEKLTEAREEADRTDVYTAESIEALNKAIEAAQAVYDAEDASQEEIDAQVTALEDAVKKLVKLPEPPKTYTITASAGEGGTITPSGEILVNEGESQTFTIAADEGWHIQDVIVNGSSVGAVETYTMSQAGTIEAVFEEDAVEPVRHEITTEAGPNGTITVTGGTAEDGTVADGADVTYKAEALEGYVIDTLTVNGTAVEAAAGQASYEGRIENITSDVKITVTFKAESTQPEPDNPDEPDKPGTPSTDKPGTGSGKPGTGSGTNSGDKAVQTGDHSSAFLWIVILAAACTAGTAVISNKKKSK